MGTNRPHTNTHTHTHTHTHTTVRGDILKLLGLVYEHYAKYMSDNAESQLAQSLLEKFKVCECVRCGEGTE